VYNPSQQSFVAGSLESKRSKHKKTFTRFHLVKLSKTKPKRSRQKERIKKNAPIEMSAPGRVATGFVAASVAGVGAISLGTTLYTMGRGSSTSHKHRRSVKARLACRLRLIGAGHGEKKQRERKFEYPASKMYGRKGTDKVHAKEKAKAAQKIADKKKKAKARRSLWCPMSDEAFFDICEKALPGRVDGSRQMVRRCLR